MASAPDELTKLFNELRDSGECVQFHVAQWLIRVMIGKEYNLSIVYLDGIPGVRFETKIYTNEFPSAAIIVDDWIGYGAGRKLHRNRQSVIDELLFLRHSS